MVDAQRLRQSQTPEEREQAEKDLVWEEVGIIPTDYVLGAIKAKEVNKPLTEAYLKQLHSGDPDADKAIKSLQHLSYGQMAGVIERAIERRDRTGAPVECDPLYDLIEKMSVVPDWFKEEEAIHGRELFYRYPHAFLYGLAAGSIIEGFTSNISKSFIYTGRITNGNQAIRRLKQNNRHFMEIFLPDGLQPGNEGWKYSLRIRLIHAKIRHLIKGQADWDTEAWGMPLSGAHMALAAASFSARLLQHTQRLILTKFKKEEERGFIMTFRYTAHLIGIPEELSTTSKERGLEIFKIASIIEPAVSAESIMAANSVIGAGPHLAGLGGRRAQILLKKIYAVSRVLVGDTMADQLHFPRYSSWGTITLFAIGQWLQSILSRYYPFLSERRFIEATQYALYQSKGISYQLPDNPHAELQKNRW